MSICKKCGHVLIENAKFCQNCGYPTADSWTTNNGQRQSEYKSKVYRCPGCGQILKSFESNCPYCGFELRGVNATNSVRELQLKLEAIESKRESSKSKNIFFNSFNKDIITTTDNQKINLITSFAIPNTKEDIYEFLILAASNINGKVLDKDPTYPPTALSLAWHSKFEQAYQKARLTFGDDKNFYKIKDLYDSCNKKINHEKHADTKFIIIIYSILFVFAIFMIIYACFIEPQLPEPSVESKIKSRENHLEDVIEEIEDDISNGEFSDARNKAYTITFDEDLSKEKSEYWNKKQQEILDIINKAATNNNPYGN